MYKITPRGVVIAVNLAKWSFGLLRPFSNALILLFKFSPELFGSLASILLSSTGDANWNIVSGNVTIREGIEALSSTDVGEILDQLFKLLYSCGVVLNLAFQFTIEENDVLKALGGGTGSGNVSVNREQSNVVRIHVKLA